MGKSKEFSSKTRFLKGAAWIAVGGFVAKIIGAVYRIPLTNLIGGHGLGLYQLVYPVYCLLLTVSATGIPSSIAKLTAERIGRGESEKPLFKTAIKLFLLIGGVGTILMALIAPTLARAQGSEGVLGGYYALAPSVFFVSVISVFRGYFQGRNQMYPTAISEITEQVVKVAVGLLFAYLYRSNIEKAVIFLLLSVSISELFTLFLMFFLYKRIPAPHQSKKEGGMVAVKSVLKLSIPVTLSSMILPLSGLVDSVLAPKLLGAYTTDAVTAYGLFAGGAVTIVSLPVSVCYGIAAASIPAVASAACKKESGGKARKPIMYALFITLLISIPSALGLYFFAQPAVKIIFRSLQGEELQTLIGLVKTFSISAVLLSCVQTLSACLTAQGKPQYAALSMLVGAVVKTVTYCFLLKKPSLSVFGLAYATNLCYLVAFLLDLVYNFIVSKNSIRKRTEDRA